MEYYFEVYAEGMLDGPVLVRAKDAIEAGKKAVAVLDGSKEARWFDEMCISRITRTDIVKVID